MSAEEYRALWEETQLSEILSRLKQMDLTGKVVKLGTQAKCHGGHFDVYRGKFSMPTEELGASSGSTSAIATAAKDVPSDRATLAIRQLRYSEEEDKDIGKVRR